MMIIIIIMILGSYLLLLLFIYNNNEEINVEELCIKQHKTYYCTTLYCFFDYIKIYNRIYEYED